MRILWLMLENFKCYSRIRIPEEGILPEGLILVEGHNSAGKSTLFDAIFYAFFYSGKDRDIGTKEDLIRMGKDEVKVELAFELEGKCYLIHKSHKKTKTVDSFFVEIDQDKALEGEYKRLQLLADSANEVNDKIVQLLGIDKERLMKTLIVKQGEVQNLAEETGANLRNTIYDLFQLEEYKTKVNQASKKKQEEINNEIAKNAITRTTEDIEQEVERVQEQILSLEQKQTEIAQNLQVEQKKLSSYPKLTDIGSLKMLENSLNIQVQNKKRLEDNIKREVERMGLVFPFTNEQQENLLSTLKTQKNILEEEMDKIDSSISDIVRDIGKTDHELDTFRKRMRELEKSSLEKGKFVCDICEHEMEEGSFRSLLERTKSNVAILSNAIQRKKNEENEKKKEKTESRNKINALQNKEQEVKRISHNIQNVQGFEHEIEKITNQFHQKLVAYGVETPEQLTQKYGESSLDSLYKAIEGVQKSVFGLSKDLETFKSSIEDKEKHLEKLEQMIKTNEVKTVLIESLKQKIDVLKHVEKLVEGFIAEDIISNRLLAGIKKETSNYIYAFTRGQYTEIFLEATKQKTLNMLIKDEIAGVNKKQSQLSGGDKAAIGLGMRIGISELLKRVRPLKNAAYQPPKPDILILDEPLASLDSERREKVLDGLLQDKKFSQIFLITHTDIKNRMAAPMISVKMLKTGSEAIFYPQATELEQESN